MMRPAGIEVVPLGQPILAGHHSERHGPRDQARFNADMQRQQIRWSAGT
ncbi:DUF3560 domain-containing protein [Streptomyces sp. SID12488]|nr:DUF3560 domain-containing protein [Streptomyces sp. SID12488]